MNKNLFYVSLSLDDLTINCVLNKMKQIPIKKAKIDTHTHSFSEIFAVLKGELIVHLADQKKVYSSGTLCIIPSGTYHYCGTAEGSIVICVRFDCLLNKQAEKSRLHENFTSLLNGDIQVVTDAHDICLKFKNAYDELVRPTVCSNVYVKALLTTSYLDVYRKLSKDGKKDNLKWQAIDNESQLRLIIEKILFQRFGERITAKEVAESLHFSERHFNRIINKFYGKSFKALLTDFRLERAVNLLVETDKTIEEIAISCGYATVKNFNVAFVKRFSITPKNYRNLKNNIKKS